VVVVVVVAVVVVVVVLSVPGRKEGIEWNGMEVSVV
jgi:hypothetical protein